MYYKKYNYQLAWIYYKYNADSSNLPINIEGEM